MLVLVIQERDKLCMIIKTGIDIIEVPRIQEAIEKYGELFLNKIFDKSEVEYCKNTGKMEYQHYAARFAAKEAVFKAISVKLEDKYSICWKDIEIINDNQGRPSITLQGNIQKNIEQIDISLSHCKEYATANVVVVWK